MQPAQYKAKLYEIVRVACTDCKYGTYATSTEHRIQRPKTKPPQSRHWRGTATAMQAATSTVCQQAPPLSPLLIQRLRHVLAQSQVRAHEVVYCGAMLSHHMVEVVHQVQAVPKYCILHHGVSFDAHGCQRVGVDGSDGKRNVELTLRTPRDVKWGYRGY